MGIASKMAVSFILWYSCLSTYRRSSNKYRYDVDISTALKLARKYFIQNEARSCIDIIKLMTRYVHAVKTEFRQFSDLSMALGLSISDINNSFQLNTCCRQIIHICLFGMLKYSF